MAKKLIKKTSALTGEARLEVAVEKDGGPLATTLEIGSTGSDDGSVSDGRLTPGPASIPLRASCSYALVWAGAFARKGSATLTVKVIDASGQVEKIKMKKVLGVAGDTFARVLLIPGGQS